MNSNAGPKTTEFWLNSVVTVITAALAITMAAGVVPPTWEAVISWGLAQAAAFGYTGFRSIVKISEARERESGALAIASERVSELTRLPKGKALD